jgi:hypothetical protein
MTSAGGGAGRNDEVDFREFVCSEHDVRGAHTLLKVLAPFRTRDRNDERARTRALGRWPADRDVSEHGVLPARARLRLPLLQNIPVRPIEEINTPKSSFPVDNAPSVPTAAIDNVASPAEAFAKGLKRRIIKI